MRQFTSFVIFGGAGFIGRHLEAHLAQVFPGAPVHVCDLRVVQEDETNHCTDVRKPFDVPGVFGSQTLIFNLAAVHKTPGHPDPEYFEANIRGAETVCAFARKHGIRNIVFTSSIAPYGAAESEKTEETLPMPNTPYGISKLVAEKIHQTWAAESPERALSIVRPGIVFGKGEGGNFTRLSRALAKGMFAYPGRKDTRKANIYVKDLVRVMLLMAQNEASVFQLYNCCAPVPASIEEIVTTLKRVLGITKPTFLIPAWPLRRVAGILGILDSLGLGFHPDRVRKLMVSTNIIGAKLHKDYPLQFSLEQALLDWRNDCGGQALS